MTVVGWIISILHGSMVNGFDPLTHDPWSIGGNGVILIACRVGKIFDFLNYSVVFYGGVIRPMYFNVRSILNISYYVKIYYRYLPIVANDQQVVGHGSKVHWFAWVMDHFEWSTAISGKRSPLESSVHFYFLGDAQINRDQFSIFWF